VRVRLPGGLEGWIGEDAIGELADRGVAQAGPPRPTAPSEPSL
jgi:hypothetical protein